MQIENQKEYAQKFLEKGIVTMKFNLVEDTLGQAISKAEDALGGPEDVDVITQKDDIFEALDKAVKVNKKVIKTGRGSFQSVLLIGHAGVGKTQRVKQWCEERGYHLVEKDMKIEDLGNLLGIFAPNDTKTKAMNLPTGAYDELDEPDTVLFIDEFNRADSKVRFTISQLINSHRIPNSTERGGTHFFSTLLLVVAAINPAKYGQYNTDELDVAENDRFKIRYVKPNKLLLLRHLSNLYDENMEDDLEEGNTEEYKADAGRKALATQLLTSREFEFDDDEDIERAAELKQHILSPRGLEQALASSDGTKESLLQEWDDNCNPDKKGMVERALANYQDIDDKANSVFKGSSPFKKSGSDNWKKIQNTLDNM